MFWSKYQFFRTARFRIAFYYSLMVLLTVCVTNATVYLIQRAHLYNSTDRVLQTFWEEFEYEYLTGEEEIKGAKVISAESLPDGMAEGLSPVYALRADASTFILLGLRGGEIIKRVWNASGETQPEKVVQFDRQTFIHAEFNHESYGKRDNEVFFLVLSPKNEILARSWFHESFLSAFTEHDFSSAGESPYVESSGALRILSKRLYDGNILVVAHNLDELNANLDELISHFLTAAIIMLVLFIAAGYLLACYFTKGITFMMETARRIGAGNYSLRVARTGDGEEMDALGDAFNEMTEKTERLLYELKTISGNIAHDLRTPLTRMRGKAELSIYSGNTDDLANDVAEECDKMLVLINTALEIIRAEHNIDEVAPEMLDLKEACASILELFSTVAEDKGVALKADLPDEPLAYSWQKMKAQQLLCNLLDNAIKFTPSGGKVHLSLQRRGETVILRVADTGCGIPVNDQPYVFNRFYRSDSSRSLTGSGLGLSLVKAIVTGRGGSVKFTSAEGKGTVFTVCLPINLSVTTE